MGSIVEKEKENMCNTCSIMIKKYILQFSVMPILIIAYIIVPILQTKKLSFLKLKRLGHNNGN